MIFIIKDVLLIGLQLNIKNRRVAECRRCDSATGGIYAP